MIIYIAKNKLNNKVYIGQTNNFKRRKYQHKHSATDCYFHRAIKKHGWKNFEFSIIEEGLSEQDVSLRETLWIDTFDSTNKKYGYNMVRSHNFTRGYKHTKKSKIKMSMSKIGHVPWNKGLKGINHKLSKESKISFNKKMSGSNNPNAKKVYQCDMNNNFITTYETVSEAAKKLEIVIQGIARCASGQRKSYKGYKWYYNLPDNVVIHC